MSYFQNFLKVGERLQRTEGRATGKREKNIALMQLLGKSFKGRLAFANGSAIFFPILLVILLLSAQHSLIFLKINLWEMCVFSP